METNSIKIGENDLQSKNGMGRELLHSKILTEFIKDLTERQGETLERIEII